MKNTIGKMVRRLPPVLLLAATLALLFLWLSARGENERLVRRLGDTQVEDLLARLCVPSEVIHGDAYLWDEVAKLRSKWCKEHGIERFLPYKNVLAIARSGLPGATAYGKGSDMSPFYPAGDVRMVMEGSFELHWSDGAWRTPWELANALERNREIASLLHERPEILEKRVVPLLKRLLEAHHEWPRRDACRALLALGDRSEEVRNALQRFLKQPMRRTKEGDMEWMDYSDDTKDAARLAKKYGLHVEADVDEILRSRKPPRPKSW